MNVLVACEESQRVCIAFRNKGHEAYSCDIQDCSGGHPEWHIKGDVLRLLNGHCVFVTMDGVKHIVPYRWDLIIAHPPCTYLTVAGNKYFDVSKYGESALLRIKKRNEAAAFFMKFVNADCDRICIENPVGYMNTFYREPDQNIHPYFFAKDENDEENYKLKHTCLWLKNLNPLVYNKRITVPEPMYIRKSDGKRVYWCEGLSCKGGNAERAKLRSKTFPGIALAMAAQFPGDCPIQTSLFEVF